jgi:hypothetical protein
MADHPKLVNRSADFIELMLIKFVKKFKDLLYDLIRKPEVEGIKKPPASRIREAVFRESA